MKTKILIRSYDFPKNIWARRKLGIYIGFIFFLSIGFLLLIDGLYMAIKYDQGYSSIVVLILGFFSCLLMCFFGFLQYKNLKIAEIYEEGLGVKAINGNEFIIPWDKIKIVRENALGLRVFSEGYRTIGATTKINNYEFLKQDILRYAKNAKYQKRFIGK